MQGSERIDELKQKFHENPRRYFAPLANEYRKAGDPEQAIAICRAHLAQQPAHMSGHVVYAQALYDAGRVDESRVVFENARSLDPGNAIVLRQLGDISRRKGDAQEARHWYTRALHADPRNREIAAYIAELTELLTDLDTVESRPESAPPIGAAHAEAIADLPVSEIDATPEVEIEAAPTEEVDAAATSEPAPSPDAEIDITRTDEPPALADIPGFEMDEAQVTVDPDIELFPDSSSPFVTRTMAELYARQGYNDQALEVYKKLAADNPHDQEIADRIRELSSPGSAAAAEPAPAVSDAPLAVNEFSEPDDDSDFVFGPFDESVAGFSTQDVAPLDFASSDQEVSNEEIIEPLAVESSVPESVDAPEPAESTAEAEDDLHEDVYRPADTPEPPETGAALEPMTDEHTVEFEAPVPFAFSAEEVVVTEEVWRPLEEHVPQEVPVYLLPEEDAPSEPVTPASTEPDHFVAYSPQPPEDEDLPHYTPVGPTIREFFAVLGTHQPPTNGAASFTARAAVPEISSAAPKHSSHVAETQPQAADEFPLVSDAFANLFPDSPVSEDDTRAAFALSGALNSQPVPPPSTSYIDPPPTPAPQAAAQPSGTQESEEDIRRFREWLDGLADS